MVDVKLETSAAAKYTVADEKDVLVRPFNINKIVSDHATSG